MNKDFCFNDTFDNFSFSESGRFLSKGNTRNKVVANLNTIKNDTPIKQAIISEEICIDNNISVDDSVFLNEFISPCEINITGEDNFDTSVKDSEELFTETPEKSLSSNTRLNKSNSILHEINSSNKSITNSKLVTDCESVERNRVTKEHSESNISVDSIFLNDLSPCKVDGSSANNNSKASDTLEVDVSDNKSFVDNIEALTTLQSQQTVAKGVSITEAAVEVQTTTVALPNNCNLSAWGLPDPILQKYEKRGITSMFEWQAKCLGNSNILQHNSNLVYSAPTSAGKTLVAEMLAIKTVLERHKKVLFILPFVSVVREKMFYFQDILGSSGVRVEGFMGSYNPPGGFQSVQVAVCTIEKANSIINRLLEEGALADIGAVIVDEMHLLGDYSRGYLLELMLTKLQYMSIRYENIQIQIIGMSATLPNLDLLGKWLKAELFVTDFRPIPLYEQCLVGGEIYNKNLKLERRLQNLPELETDTDNILQLCLETIQNSCSVLIFCPTKNWCENLSQQIAMAFWKLGCSKSPFGLILREQLNCDLIKELLEQLKRCPVGLDKILEKSVSYGVAFHHAGLTMDERDIIESAFRNGALRILVATSTLSSGVNLPARRVIIRTPMFHRKPIDSLVYRQMIGRAGRMGKDTCGESILICQKTDYRIAKELLSAELQPIESCLEGTGRLKRAILEVVASGVAATPDDVTLFTNCTLLAISEEQNENVLQSPIDEAVDFLCRNEFIRLQKLEDGTSKYIPTSLGKACLSSSMPPEEGLALFSEMEKARQCFVLETELHLIYTVTPYSACNQWTNLDWLLFLELWEKLPASMKRVGELVGIRESYIINATRNKIQTNTSKLYQKLQIHRRFFTALALQDLVNEVPLNDVAVKFGCSRGMLQSLQQSASTFAGMLTIFSRQLGWSSMEILISQFQDRLQFGISRDLLDLMRLPILNGPRARALYNAGIETLAHLASIDVCAVENILHKIVPFESEKERDGETEFAAQQRNKVRGIFVTGKEGLTEREAAEMLKQDARRYLQLELGLAEAKWEGDKSVKNPEESSKSLKKLKEDNLNSIVEKPPKEKEECINLKTHSNCEEEPEKHNQDNIIQKTSEDKEECIKLKNRPNFEEKVNNDQQEDDMESNVSFELRLSSESLNKSSDSLNINNCNLELNESKDIIESSPNALSNIENKSSFIKTFNASDQNLFEDSFELNQQLANCAISAENCHTDEHREMCKSETSSSNNNVNSGDSGLDFENGSFLEHAFVSSFDLELEESHGKISDVVANSPDSNVSQNFSVVTLRQDAAKNVITCSQNEINSVISLKDLSISDTSTDFKISRSCRKRERMGKETNRFCSPVDEDESYNEQTPSKKRKMQTAIEIKDNANFYSEKSKKRSDFELKKNRSVDFKRFHIVDVCNDKELFKTFYNEVLKQRTISLSFACTKVSQQKPLIGANIVGNNIQEQIANPQPFVYKDRHVVGLTIAWGGNTAYYVSFSEAVIPNINKIVMLRKLFSDRALKMRIFDCKEQVKVAKLYCDIDLYCAAEDPKVADWLIDPEDKEKNLQAMALKYKPDAVSLSQQAGNCKGVGSIGLDLYSTIEPRIRSAVEAVVTWHLCESLYHILSKHNIKLLETYKIEMSTILILARMELNGLGVNMTQLQDLASDLKQCTIYLEKQAYSLAGRSFSFTSSKDVAKVLGVYKGRKVSMDKQKLEKQDNPVAKLIVLWRKLNNTLTRMVYPLMRTVEYDRIHGCCVTHSSTGRISMHEPNLQNIPRNFEVDFPSNSESVISCRMAFVPRSNHIFLSADYCQLELRLLTHFSRDPSLCTIMKSNQDVFKSIAAKWKNTQEIKISDEERQWAKQLCYGIIYGMGIKALAEQLSASEDEATKYLYSFHDCYPFIRKYIEETVNKCKDLGYVETIAGRKRYLSKIKDAHSAARSQAERQAVNTTIQGSAADIAKKALVLVEDRFKNKFRQQKNLPKLVLHLHDELLYEVPEKYLKKTASILKQSMEEAVHLSVPLPVKLKSGFSWGSMTELVV